jgi:hypothetical protein
LFNTDRIDPLAGDLAGGTLAGLVADGSLLTNTDPFNSDIAPNDVTLRVRVKKSFLGNSVLTNVCTYPANTNSDYSDCVSNEGGGFLNIVKNTSGGDGSFTSRRILSRMVPAALALRAIRRLADPIH